MSGLEEDFPRLLRLKDERIGQMERRLRETEEEAAVLRRNLHKCQSVLRGGGFWSPDRPGVSAEPVEQTDLRRFCKSLR